MVSCTLTPRGTYRMGACKGHSVTHGCMLGDGCVLVPRVYAVPRANVGPSLRKGVSQGADLLGSEEARLAANGGVAPLNDVQARFMRDRV